jgi:hypothetical protein
VYKFAIHRFKEKKENKKATFTQALIRDNVTGRRLLKH